MSPFTLTRTCSRISARSETVRASARSATATTTDLIICNSLESNILTQRPEQLFKTVEHAAFSPRVLLRLSQDFFLGESRRNNARCRARCPPRGLLASVGRPFVARLARHQGATHSRVGRLQVHFQRRRRDQRRAGPVVYDLHEPHGIHLRL